ncbi:RNA polymerase II-associated protein 1 [Battus philenor]|uniref:RNA polymerase II-associated protein 1 n=1 Tax=Battus philenor TaxID=42288 RepID=UPI0035D0FDDB
MIKRPKPGENEDDLLRMQEEFLRNKNTNQNLQPAAQVVNLRRTEHQTTKRTTSTDASTRKPSKYALSKGLTNNSEKRARKDIDPSPLVGDIVEKNSQSEEDNQTPDIDDDKVYFPKILPSVLGDIIEKNNDKFIDFETYTMPSEGFPIVTKYDPTIATKHKSIHALHLEKLHKNDTQMDVDEPHSSKEKISRTLNLSSKSYVLSSEEAQTIHSENNERLAKMSEKEILEEQQKLLSNLDPKLIEFFKTKRKQNYTETEQDCVPDVNKPQEMDISEETLKVKDITPNENEILIDHESLWENDILSNPNINKWLHFDTFEKDKLEWMKAIANSKKIKPDEPYEARFDLKGYLLPYTMDYTEETKTLFHHGEEPHRPGYSLTELIELSRSTIAQQRVMALNTIAGILEYYNAGTYKDIMDLPITKIFFIIRIAIDENKTIILEPALKAMRNLIYNRVDEASLDALLGFEEGTFQPCLENDKSEIEELESKESELKDFHLAEIDIITVLLRTDILQRLYYVLDVIKPSFNCVQYCLQILTRLSRDSEETAIKIVNTEHLMLTIINYFLPTTGINFTFDSNSVYKGKPMLAALKLFRVLSLQNKDIDEILIKKYGILKPLSEYISSGVDSTYGMHLQVEAISILTNCLHYKCGMDNADSVFPVIVTLLYKHVKGTDITYNSSVISIMHAAIVLQFVNKLFQCNINLDKYKSLIYPLLKEGVQKWLSQVSNFEKYTCGHLRLVSSLLDCCGTVIQCEKQTVQFLNVSLKNLVQSCGFKELIKHLIPSSNLLSSIDAKDFHFTKNLVNIGSIVIDSTQRELPILNITSPLPFLASLFKVLTFVNDRNICNSYIEHVLMYLRKLANKSPSLSDNWFTRMETDFVFNTVKVAVQSDIAESKKDLLYTVANKLCYILRVDKKYELQYLFENIIFNKQWFSAERLFNLVSLSEKDGFSKVFTCIEDIKVCYSKVINVSSYNFESNINLKKWKEPILPRDWMYLPILALYSKSQEVNTQPRVFGDHAEKIAEQKAKEKEVIVSSSLEWILFNEMCFPDLLDEIDVTDRFCRIMCVFLCDNSLFLEHSIKLLLKKCIEVLFKSRHKFNFDKQLTGLNNFQDFYMQFLEHFQGVSYGDPCFAACVLVPLAQRHNVKWRKMLWSEYAGCLRALDCPESYLCYDLKDYLYPEEKDESLLKCYFRALNSNLLRPGTIVHKIAEHHVNNMKL